MTLDHQGRLVALFGYPVEHSLSPAMHNAAFAERGLELRYVLLPVPPDRFAEQVRQRAAEGYAGWNVTVPHKERMVAYLDEADDAVRATGDCNTVRVEGGRLSGFNTDAAGFMAGLDEAGGIEPGSRVVLLGAGGAARAVAWALAQAGHDVLVLARRPEQAEALAAALRSPAGVAPAHGDLDSATLDSELKRAALLVNCTPSGMWPHEQESPLPEGLRLRGHLLVYDLVYRPRPTRLLQDAAASGCRTQDGLAMLVNQGAAAFELWTGQAAPRALMREACIAELSGAAPTQAITIER
jgi:shikimate dehydrogenase